MRIVSATLSVAMMLFTIVQFNDPDALHWVAIYGVAAIWCGVAAFRPSLTADGWGQRLLILSALLGLIGTIWYFPKTPEFWRTDVWWVTETAREGMGMMVAFFALVVAWFTTRRSRLRSH
jgi:hypothetical protein